MVAVHARVAADPIRTCGNATVHTGLNPGLTRWRIPRQAVASSIGYLVSNTAYQYTITFFDAPGPSRFRISVEQCNVKKSYCCYCSTLTTNNNKDFFLNVKTQSPGSGRYTDRYDRYTPFGDPEVPPHTRVTGHPAPPKPELI